jgi:fumarate reductase flavoprotein subunit
VTITVTEDQITEVAITGDAETPTLGGVAVSTMGSAMVDAQTPHVDGISGATVTSTAIITAAEEALTEAGADVNQLDAAAGKLCSCVVDVLNENYEEIDRAREEAARTEGARYYASIGTEKAK